MYRSAFIARLGLALVLLLSLLASAPGASAQTHTPAPASSYYLGGIYTRVISFSVPIAQERTGIASCNYGDDVLNGMYSIDSDQLYTHAVSSYPASRPATGTAPGYQWAVQVFNGGGVSVNVTVTAICAPHGAFGASGLKVSRYDYYIPGSTNDNATTYCPSGYKSLGGGYTQGLATSQTYIYQFYSPTSSSWSVHIHNGDTGTDNTSLWAICYPSDAPIVVKDASFSIGTFDAGAREGWVGCDAGYKSLGGIYSVSSDLFTILRSYSPQSNSWAVRVMKNWPFSSANVTMRVLCYPR
jgi:hypothetical protein